MLLGGMNVRPIASTINHLPEGGWQVPPLEVSQWNSIFTAVAEFQTPLLLLDPQVVRRNVEAIRSAFRDIDVWYAFKCNPDPRIAQTLAALGVGFEVASANELLTVLQLGVPAERIMCLHTIKSPDFIRLLRENRVSVLAVDCREEVEKIAQFAPGCQVVIRVEAEGKGSRIPLGGKFGCDASDVVDLSRFARSCGLDVAGVTMHVGSQCERLDTWSDAFGLCRTVSKRLTEAEMPPRIISLGGGLPVPYTRDVPTLTAIGERVQSSDLRGYGADGCRVTVEPGRAIVASAGTLVVSVVGTATRGGVHWVYLDAGPHHGLFEWLPGAGGLTMPIAVENQDRPMRLCRLAGPTCDSYDVLPGEFQLPELRTGDRLAFRFAGAYTTSTATRFNGFDPPAIVVLSDRAEVQNV